MRLHELAPADGARSRRKRVARGNSGQGGTYAGRGVKGQNARTGGAKEPFFEGGQLPFVRRLPFIRGFTNIFRIEYTPVNVDRLEALFDSGTVVTPMRLFEAGVIKTVLEPYKVLGSGKLAKSLTVQAPRFSASARQIIEAAGGSCEALADDFKRPGMRREHKRGN